MIINIVQKGYWLYGSVAKTPVDVIAVDFDWWYDMAKEEETLELGEEPLAMGEEGFLYYVRFQKATQTTGPTWVDSSGHQKLEDAMAYAESKLEVEIKWY
jgi:hypothetical protein